ncbi:MAG TPA: MFS transporter [Ilumatobacteraceae bacterium]|nr:MFS transporter [Ilumatobacteraceae bacterium]
MTTLAEEHENTYGIDPQIYHRRKSIHAVLCLSLVIIVMAVSSLNVAIPSIVKALDAGSSEMLWIMEAYALVFAGVLLPAGALGDRYGRKKMLLIGLAIFSSMALIAGFSSGPGQLIAARAVMGIGAALIMPATLSIITNVFPPHERGKAIATWAGFAGAGGALGPLLSGLVLRWVGEKHWGAVFFINIPLALVLIGLVWYLVPDSKDPSGHSIDPIGAAISVVALTALVFGVIEAPHWGWLSPGVLGAFALAIGAGLAFLAIEYRAAHPMLDPRLFRYRGFSMGALTITAAFMCMFGMYLLLAQYLQFVKGFTPLDSAVRTLPAAVVMVLVAPRSPIVARRLGMKNLIRLGFTLIAVGFYGFSTLGVESPYWHLVIFLVIMSAGMAMCMAPTSATIVSSLPLAKAGVGSAVNDLTREVGGAIGIAVLGSLMTTKYTAHMKGALAPFDAQIPAAARGPVIDSIQGALAVAKNAPAQFAEPLRDAAKHGFVRGFHLAMLVAMGVALAAMLIISSLIPNRPPLGESHAAG